MQIFKNNRFLKALIYLMLISAVLHMFVLVLHFVATLDFAPLNFFKIIGLDIFYPAFAISIIGKYLSFVTALSIYVLAYFLLTNKKKNRKVI